MTVLRRAVFDTSSLVGAALQPGSVPYRALSAALGMGDVCASEATLAELDAVLSRPRLDRFQSPERRMEFAALVRRQVHLFAVTPAEEAAVHPPCHDPEDNKFLALAAVCAAQVLVSSDADLQVLHPWNGVHIVSPAAFLALVRPAA
jgi:uncharacterized protein